MTLFNDQPSTPPPIKVGECFKSIFDNDTIYQIYEVINDLVYLDTGATSLTCYPLQEFCEELQAGSFYRVSTVSSETLEEETDIGFYANAYYHAATNDLVVVTNEIDDKIYLSNFVCYEKDEFLELVGSEFFQVVGLQLDSFIKVVELKKYDFGKFRYHLNLEGFYIKRSDVGFNLHYKRTKTKIKILKP